MKQVERRAVIPIHLYGQMMNMTGLGARPDIAIIEDCAHCFEDERDGYKPGVYSTCVTLFFVRHQELTCGESARLSLNYKAMHGSRPRGWMACPRAQSSDR